MSFSKKFIKYGLISAVILISLLAINLPIAQAVSILPACAASGRCTVCDIVQTAINIGQFILGIIGAVVLLFFVYGGFIMLTSGGRPDWVKKGKDILINAIIGLLIAFFAYTVVTFVVSAVTKQGWDWENKLECAPLPDPIKYTAPDRNTNAAGNTNTSKTPVGGACTKSNECLNGLFCRKDKTCQKKLTTNIECSGESIEAAALMAGGRDINDFQVLTASNVACLSGDCSSWKLVGPPTCDKPKAGTGNIAIGDDCVKSVDCNGGYCSKPDKKCTVYKKFGEACDGLATDYDNYVCGNDSAVAKCDDWGNNMCVPGTKVGKKDDPCTSSEQCQRYDVYGPNGLFCAAKDWNPNNTTNAEGGGDKKTGTCQPKGIKGAYCGKWEVRSLTDAYACQTGPGKCPNILGGDICQ